MGYVDRIAESRGPRPNTKVSQCEQLKERQTDGRRKEEGRKKGGREGRQAGRQTGCWNLFPMSPLLSTLHGKCSEVDDVTADGTLLPELTTRTVHTTLSFLCTHWYLLSGSSCGSWDAVGSKSVTGLFLGLCQFVLGPQCG